MIKTAFASSIGRVRESNQDFVQIFQNRVGVTMAIVCDGMGGNQGGDVASTMAVSHLATISLTPTCTTRIWPENGWTSSCAQKTKRF